MSQNSELVPKIRFKEFENAGDWKLCKLEEVVNITMGQSPSSDFYTDNPNDYILVQGNADMKNGKVVPRVWTTQVTKMAYVGDLILSVRAPVGDIGKTDYDVVIGRGVASISGNEFIFQLFKKLKINNFWSKLSTGSTFESINSNVIKEISIYLPTEQEQKQIGKILKTLDDTITLHQRKLDKLNNIKQSYLYQMFPQNGEKVPSLRFSEFSEEWKSNSMGEFGKTYTGLNGKTKDDFGHGKAKFVTYMNVYKNTISNPNLVEEVELDSRQNEVKYGDVLFTTSSETPEEVGLSSVWLNNSENVYLNSFCFGYRPIINIDSYYLAYMLRSQSIRKKIILLAQGISRYNISKSKMMDIEIVFPKLEEQKKIGQFFKRLDENIDIQEQELEKLKNLKEAYLNEMFV